MSFSISLPSSLGQELAQLWELPEGDQVIEMTTFGDFFVQHGEAFLFYSLTDATISDVTSQVQEFGLPPVSIELGDEWYQLDAKAALDEQEVHLKDGQCFGFKQPLYEGGEYSLENIELVDMLKYHRAAKERGLSEA